MLNDDPTDDATHAKCIAHTPGHAPSDAGSLHHTRKDSKNLCLNKPLPPIIDMDPVPSRTPPPQRKLNMSLFSLFSRPKVQCQRGYVEAGLPSTAPPVEVAKHSCPASSVDTHPPRCASAFSARTAPVEAPTHRPGIYLSARRPSADLATHGRHAQGRHSHDRRSHDRHSHDRTLGRQSVFWESHPFFQAHSQAIKYGIAEVPSSTEPATVLKRSKAARRAIHSSVDNSGRPSIEGDVRRASRSGPGALHRKVFLLIPAGVLLQYAEHGPSERLPERVLHLGDTSAAFASDLIPGEHFVVQISRSVDANGRAISPAPTGSLFTRMTSWNTAASRRVASRMLLVLPDAADMVDWIRVLRDCIKMQHEHQSRRDSCSEVSNNPVDGRNGSDNNPVDSRNGSGNNPVDGRNGSGNNSVDGRNGSGNNPVDSRNGSGNNPVGSRNGSGNNSVGSRNGSGNNPVDSRNGIENNPVDSRNGSDNHQVDAIPLFVRKGVEIEAQLHARSNSLMSPPKNLPLSYEKGSGCGCLSRGQTDPTPSGKRVHSRKRRVSEPPIRVTPTLITTTKSPGHERREAEAFLAKLALGSSYVRSPTAHARQPSDASTASSVTPSPPQRRLGSRRSSVRVSTTSYTTAKTSRTSSVSSEIGPRRQSNDSITAHRNMSGRRPSALPTPATPTLQLPTPAAPTLYLQTGSIDLLASSPAPDLSPIESPVIGHSNSLTPPLRISLVAPTDVIHAKQSLPNLACRRARHGSKLAAIPPVSEDLRPQSFVGDLPSPFLWSKSHSTAKRITSTPALRSSNVQCRTSTFPIPLRVNPVIAQQHAGVASTVEVHSAPPSTHTPNALFAPSPSGSELPLRKHRVSLFPSPQKQHMLPLRPTSRSARTPTTPLAQSPQLLTPPFRTPKHYLSSTSLRLPSPSMIPNRSSSVSRSASPTPSSASPKTRLHSFPHNPSTASLASVSTLRPPTTVLPALDLGLPISALGPPAPPPLAPLPMLPVGTRPGSAMSSRKANAKIEASRPVSPLAVEQGRGIRVL